MTDQPNQSDTNSNLPSEASPSPSTPAESLTQLQSPQPKVELVEGWIQRVGKLRDGVLTSVGVAYIAGYLIWSYNAWKCNLGFLPAAQAQYFTAGLIPCIGLLCIRPLTCIMAFLSAFLAIAISLVGRRIPFLNRHWGVTLPFMLIIRVGSWVLLTPYLTRLLRWEETIFSPISLSFGLIFGGIISNAAVNASWKLTPIIGEREEIPRFTNFAELEKLGKSITYGPYAIIGIFAFSAFFANVIYPVLPQEIGGARPRTAFLDVKRLDLSPETRLEILPRGAIELPADVTKDRLPVARSLKVDVYFPGSDFFLLRRHGTSVDSPIFQIKKESIQSVLWCGSDVTGTPLVPVPEHAPVQAKSTAVQDYRDNVSVAVKTAKK